jgi:hypothetical protein
MQEGVEDISLPARLSVSVCLSPFFSLSVCVCLSREDACVRLGMR